MVGARRVNQMLEKRAAVFAGELRRNLWEPRRVVWEDLGYLGFCSVRAARGERSRGGRLKRGPKPQVGPERSCQAGFSAAGTHVQRGSRTVLSDSESWHLYFLLSSLRLFLNVLSPNMGILFMHTGLWVLSQELYGLVMVCSLPETLRGPHLQSHPGSLEPCWSPRA